jgi:hypothetical protein
VKAFKVIALVVYVSYLVQMGLLMIWLPWSSVWNHLVVRMPLPVAWFLDAPWTKGAIAAFGVLHLAMVVAELIWVGSLDASRQREGSRTGQRDRSA